MFLRQFNHSLSTSIRKFAVSGNRLGFATRGFSGTAELDHEWIYSSTTRDQVRHTAVVLHGILGNHKNLRQFARAFCEEFPNFRMLMVTHRRHGLSKGGEPPHTLEACSEDLAQLFSQYNISNPDIVIGHSFGGRVAQQMYKRSLTRGIAPPRITWVLDNVPGDMKHLSENANHLPDPDSVFRVIKKLVDVEVPVSSKQDLVQQLCSMGLSEAVAHWMTLNLVPASSDRTKYTWAFDLAAIHEMMDDMVSHNFWPMLLNQVESPNQVNFVRADRNASLWTPKVLEDFSKNSNPAVTLTELPNSGHWVHVDNPKGLRQMMFPSFQYITDHVTRPIIKV